MHGIQPTGKMIEPLCDTAELTQAKKQKVFFFRMHVRNQEKLPQTKISARVCVCVCIYVYVSAHSLPPKEERGWKSCIQLGTGTLMGKLR